MEYLGSSSPDPLNDSPTYYSPLKTRHSATSTRSFPLHGSSPSKQTFELDVGNQSSPQRLIVTVEADTSGIVQAYRRGINSSSPSRRSLKTRERTTTTTVPLKGLTDDEGEARDVGTPRKSRGRPRKSNGTPIQPKSSRQSTPGRSSSKTRRSFGDLVDGDDDQDMNYHIGRNVEVRRGAGSRSRSVKSKLRKSLDAPEDDMSISGDVPKRGRGRPRKSMSPSKSASSGAEQDLDHGADSEPVQAETGAEQRLDEVLMEPSITESDEGRDLDLEGVDVSGTSIDHENDTHSAAQLANSQLYESGDDQFIDENDDMDMNEDGIEIEGGVEDDVGGEEEDDDQLGEMREYDTIMESEEFSMISVDSVPSLRQHFSSPADQEAAAPVSQSLVRKAIAGAKAAETYNDSFSEVPDVILAAATPARNPRNDLLAVPATVDNSFSSVPPQILEAATPGWKNHITKLKNATPAMDDSFSSVGLDILEAATPGRVLGRDLSARRRDLQPTSSKQTTPLSSLVVPKIRNSSVQSKDTMVDRPEELPFDDEKKQRVVSAALSTTSSRLLTPDETPSPSIASSHSSARTRTQEAFTLANQVKASYTQPSGHEQSFMQSYMPSSPPTMSQQSHSEPVSQTDRSSLRTPYISHASPKLPSPRLEERGEPSKSTMQQRPELAPAARAGHVLQQSVLIPSSPRARSDSLGSPFKSPTSERRSSLTYPCLPLPSQEGFVGPDSLSSHTHQDENVEDPFSQLAQVPAVPGRRVDDDQLHPSSARGKTKIVNSRFSSIRSADVSTMSGSAMSWQPEQEITIAVESASREVPDVLKRKWEQERAAVSSQIGSADPTDVVVVDSGGSSSSAADEDDEGLKLLLETINSASPIKQSQEPADELFDKPRRSKLPSPWRKNSKRLVYSDELKQSESTLQQTTTVSSTNHVSQNRIEPTIKLQREKESIVSDDLQDMDLSGYQIPQKSNFKPRPRQSGNLEFAALMSPIKPLPTLTKSQENTRPDPLQSETAHLSRPQAHVTESTAKSFAAIPQKAVFLPSPRKASKPYLFAAPVQPRLFTPLVEDEEPATLSERAPLTQKHAQALNRPSSREPTSPGSTSPSSFSAQNQGNSPSSQKSRTLQWTRNLHLATNIAQTPLPDKHASPTKSCFRTPSFGLQQQHHQARNLSPSKNVVFVSSSPAIASPCPEQLLSATDWGKKHWLLLETIMFSHQPSPPSSSSSNLPTTNLASTSQEAAQRRKRNSTRVISKLLGRRIVSQGMEMRFQQWHLEAVDEFREKVGGWQEKDVAEKLFGLIVAAERRRLRALGEMVG